MQKPNNPYKLYNPYKRADYRNIRSKTMVWAVIVFCCALWPLSAAEKSPLYNDLDIYGDQIDYDKNQGKINATGNVAIRYKNYNINTAAIKYDLFNQKLECPDQFQIQKTGQKLKTKFFYYDFGKSTGEADDLDAQIERMRISGKKVQLFPDKAIIHTADFTTCDEPVTKHYIIEAKRIELYPKWGFFVAFDNTLTTTFLPFRPWVPTYIYGAGGLISKGTTPIPEMGSSKREGGYIKQRYGYFQSEKSNGTVDLAYYQNLGLSAGVSHFQMLDTSNYFNTRLHYYERDGIDGALEFHKTLLEGQTNENEPDTVINTFLNRLGNGSYLPLSQLSILLQHREIMNDSRVSYVPMAKLDTNQFIIPYVGAYINNSIYAAKIKEDTIDNAIIEDRNYGFSATLGKQMGLGKNMVVEGSVTTFQDWYDSGARWRRVFARCDWGINDIFLNPRIGFTKKLQNSGNTPFEFQRLFALQDDEINLSVKENFGALLLGAQVDYELPNKRYRNVMIITGWKLHCWQLNVLWNTILGQFQLGVDIY